MEWDCWSVDEAELSNCLQMAVVWSRWKSKAFKSYTEKTKMEVSKAKEQPYENVYEELARIEGQQKVFHLTTSEDDEQKTASKGIFVKGENEVALYESNKIVSLWGLLQKLTSRENTRSLPRQGPTCRRS